MREIDIGELQVVAGGNGVTTHTYTVGPNGYAGTTTTYTPVPLPQGDFLWSGSGTSGSGGIVFHWDTTDRINENTDWVDPANPDELASSQNSGDNVGWGYVGISVPTPMGVYGAGSYYTSDGRHIGSVSQGITVGLPIVDFGMGYATNSDAFTGLGFTSGAFFHGTIADGAGAFGVSDSVGTSVSFGVEIHNDPNIVFVDGVSMYVFQPEP